MNNIPDRFYRISIKALVLNETRDKFLVCEKEGGSWELPGGGLDWGANPKEDLAREIDEEMKIKTVRVVDNPTYFITCKTLGKELWVANVIYEAELEHLDFTPSDECINIKFINKTNIGGMKLFPAVGQLVQMFKSENHLRFK